MGTGKRCTEGGKAGTLVKRVGGGWAAPAPPPASTPGDCAPASRRRPCARLWPRPSKKKKKREKEGDGGEKSSSAVDGGGGRARHGAPRGASPPPSQERSETLPVVQSGVAQSGSRGAAPGWLCPRRRRAASGAAAGRGGDGWPPSTAPGGRGGDGRPLLFLQCDWPLEGGRHPRHPASRQGNACTHASAIASSEEWQGCDQYVL